MSGFDYGSLINPYLSKRRVLILTQLAQALPNAMDTLASNSPATGAKFTEWTGQTQKKLEDAWKSQNFVKDEKSGSWTRIGGGAVTTSCEGLIGRVLFKIPEAGLGQPKGGVTSFNLCGNNPNTGKEAATPPVGWYWYNRSPYDQPQPGDLFQTGEEMGPGRWRHAHVGVITRWDDSGDQPKWETVEAGQGGPLRGYDFMKRNAFRLVFPVSRRDPRETLMGWLNIDEYFG